MLNDKFINSIALYMLNSSKSKIEHTLDNFVLLIEVTFMLIPNNLS